MYLEQKATSQRDHPFFEGIEPTHASEAYDKAISTVLNVAGPGLEPEPLGYEPSELATSLTRINKCIWGSILLHSEPHE